MHSDPPHLWNPKWAAGNPGPDGVDDSGDEDTSQQALFVRDGVFVEPVTCMVPEGGIAGDLDGDGTVAFADFLALSTNFGQADQPYENGDIDCDGTIAFADFLTMSSNFGQRLPVLLRSPSQVVRCYCCSVWWAWWFTDVASRETR